MSHISNLRMECGRESYTRDEDVLLKVKFSVLGEGRDAFNEENWTRSYNSNDVAIKIKYGIRLTTGGIHKKELGRVIDSYRKAAIFWTRNPKLVNPMKDRRIWVQVAKNFTPIIGLSEEEVRKELFDFEEKYVIKAQELGLGTHKIGGDAYVSWHKHHFLDKTRIKESIPEIYVQIK